MDHNLDPGDNIFLDGQPAEVIRTQAVGDLPYVRVFIDGVGPKTVCLDDVTIEPRPDTIHTLNDIDPSNLHPSHETVSADQFDLRTQALRLQLAHEQGQLLSLNSSLVRLEPYQLECVNEVMRKLRQRVLIADDVGLGKTIEAGLIFKELDARRRAERVLFVVPAHLQNKWIREMDRFFDLELTQADRTWVDGERRRLGSATNIWNQEGQRLVTSMAFLRSEEFDEELEDAFWDLVIVDEVHKAAKRGESPSITSQRVEQVAHQSDSLLLLSATPHDGKEDSFRSLISYIDPFLVAEGKELTRDMVDEVMIRRGKETIFDDDGNRVFPNRDVRTVPVEMTAKEEEFYDAVSEYVREVYNRSDKLNEPVVGFAMALMQKRLVSSVGAIRETLRRRLQHLLEVDELELSADARAYLDGDDLDEEGKERVEKELTQVTVPGGDAELVREIEVLQELVEMAENLPLDSKATKVQRYIQTLIEDQPDEKVLLFTEYTDTLEYLLDLFEDEPWSDEILVIHGDVDKEDRTAIEDEFNYGRSRILIATDAASEGIDLQKSCHIMINYELPWNPNKLEQRIGRIHRYGQDKEVKVWNFQFERSDGTSTREAEIFELLQDKVETIRSKVGTTADVLGMLDDLDIDSLLMESLQDQKPPSATREEFQELVEEREQTLLEWFDRSLVDCSTFDRESRQEILELVDESEEVFGTESDVRAFVTHAIRQIDGDLRRLGASTYDVSLPEQLSGQVDSKFVDIPITFDREHAMEQEDVAYAAPDSSLVQVLMAAVLEDDGEFGSKLGLKVLSSLDEAGITFLYKIAFEDGSGEILKEEIVPVFVGISSCDPNRQFGQQVMDTASLQAKPERNEISRLVTNQDDLREQADRYISQYVRRERKVLVDDREKETERELGNLEAYAESERERIQEFIQTYKQEAATGRDMDIAIRRQQERLRKLEDRIQQREENIRKKGQVISLVPDLEGLCLVVPT